MRIILIGASGVGKSTLLEHFEDLRRIQEVARKLHSEKGIKLNEAGDIQTQVLIWEEYERLLSSKEDYISDRGLIDVLSYTLANIGLMPTGRKRDMMEDLYEEQCKKLEKFVKDNPDIYYIFVPIEFKMEKDGIRSENEHYRNLTQDIMKKHLDQYVKDYLVVHGGVEERINQIKEYLGKHTSNANEG